MVVAVPAEAAEAAVVPAVVAAVVADDNRDFVKIIIE